MSKIAKMLMLAFGLLILMSLVSQALAAERYFLVCTAKGLKIYVVPDPYKETNWSNPVAVLDKDFSVKSIGFNSEGTIMYTQVGEPNSNILLCDFNIIHFYEVPKDGDLRKITRIANTLEVYASCSVGFNLIDGTFYTYSAYDGVRIYNVSIDPGQGVRVTFSRSKKKINIYSKSIIQTITFNPNDPTSILCLSERNLFSCRLAPDGALDGAMKVGDHLDSLIDSESFRNVGFAPSGNIFYILSIYKDSSYSFRFYKMQEKRRITDSCRGSFKLSGKEDGGFKIPFHGGYLDSKHFFVCSEKGIEIFRSTLPCDQWTVDNEISKESFKKATLEKGVACLDAVLFSPKKEVPKFSPKALKKYEDISVRTTDKD